MSSPSLEASKPRLGTYLEELGLLEGEPWAQGGGRSLAPRSNVLCVSEPERSPPHAQCTKKKSESLVWVVFITPTACLAHTVLKRLLQLPH